MGKKLEINSSMIFANENNSAAYRIFDSNCRTRWTGGLCPGYVDVRFEKIVSLEKIVFECNKNSYSIFSIFKSDDGVSFSEVVSQNDETVRGGRYAFDVDLTCAALRFFIKYNSSGVNAEIKSVELYGEYTEEAVKRAEVSCAESFDESKYNVEITKKDMIEALEGLVKRTVPQFSGLFDFVITQSDEEYYELSDENGRIRIEAGSAINAAAGLGYYYKYFCKMNFSQVGNRVAVPKALPKIGRTLRMSTPFKVRYSYNYCALSYTMAFWGEKEWEEELDRLALQGINVVLDITALEEVWRRFLQRLGYTHDETAAFITGPAYYAWFNMANIYSTGGPVPDEFFKMRTRLARKNHLYMRKLGMLPVLQGYSGMIPVDIKRLVPDAQVLRQGLWNGLERPAMLKVTSKAYDRLAKLFYDCQKEVFGDNTVYFATDPFHEGGKSGAMKLDRVSKKIMDCLLESYPKAVWILQSWGENPSRELLEGIADKKEHTLVLDLYAEKKPRWESFLDREFLGTPWAYCMLNNFGGRMGLHGHLRTIAAEIARAAGEAEFMKGIGVTPEATFSNPMIFDLFFETAWSESGKPKPVELEGWLCSYAERRYGGCTESMRRALMLLNDTVYNPLLNEHGEGAPESVINSRPSLKPTSPSTWGNDIVAYDKHDLEEAVRLFSEDYDLYCDSEGYRFDLADFLKQILSNTAQEYQRRLAQAFNQNDLAEFKRWSDKFLTLARYTDTLLSSQQSFLLGSWINKAKALSKDFDDFSKKLFEFNARALITTWAGSRQAAEDGGLRDYSNKQWAGLTKDFYIKRWELWINNCISILNGKEIKEPDWFRLESRWTWETGEYTDIPSDLDLKEAAKTVLEQFCVDTAK